MGRFASPILPEIFARALCHSLARTVARALRGSMAPIVVRGCRDRIAVRLGVGVPRAVLAVRRMLRLRSRRRRPSLTLVAAPELGEWIALPDQPGKLGERIAGARWVARAPRGRRPPR